GDGDSGNVLARDLASDEVVADLDGAGAGLECETAGAEDRPVQRTRSQVGVSGRLGFGVGEETRVRRYSVVRARAEIRDHDVPVDADGYCGVDRADGGVSVHGVGAVGVAASGTG